MKPHDWLLITVLNIGIEIREIIIKWEKWNSKFFWLYRFYKWFSFTLNILSQQKDLFPQPSLKRIYSPIYFLTFSMFIWFSLLICQSFIRLTLCLHITSWYITVFLKAHRSNFPIEYYRMVFKFIAKRQFLMTVIFFRIHPNQMNYGSFSCWSNLQNV